MNKNLSYIFIGLTLSLGVFSSCNENKPKGSRTDTPTSGAIQFVSDESFSPIIEEERQQFEFEYPTSVHRRANWSKDDSRPKDLPVNHFTWFETK